MLKPKLSIIVPVYKAEKYISKCLDSLVGQTLENIEIVCVNDGSPDNSLNILNEYADKYENVVVIDKKNAGVWRARLDGIKKATGEYIGFVDSDDYLDKDFAKYMYESVTKNKSDMAVCGFERIDSKTQKVLSSEMKYDNSRVIDMDKNPEEVISVNTSLWNKIFKAEILKDIEKVQKPPRILEDMMFLSIVYLSTKKISFVDKYLYKYMVIEGSAMNTLKEADIDSIKNAMLEVKNIYIEKNASSNSLEILSNMAFLHLGISLMFTVYKANKSNFGKEYKNINSYLNEHFYEWKRSKYTTLIYNFTHGRYNLKVAIVRKIYKLHMFRLFIATYYFVISKLKIDIKW